MTSGPGAPRPEPPDRTGDDRPVRLTARLDLPQGELEVAAGQAVALPDDPVHVAALVGDDRRRGHRLWLDGRRLDRRPPAGRVRAGLITVGDAPVAPELTVRDHLAAVVRPQAADRLLAATPHLAALGPRPAGQLSGGERRLLAWTLACALAPAVVVLDRAGTGLDATALAWAGEVVAGWRAAGVGLLVRVGRDEERAWLRPTSPP
jgi:ABC-type lipopolysaccharide export system ATPase subunit